MKTAEAEHGHSHDQSHSHGHGHSHGRSHGSTTIRHNRLDYAGDKTITKGNHSNNNGKRGSSNNTNNAPSMDSSGGSEAGDASAASRSTRELEHELLEACAIGDMGRVQTALDAGASLNCRSRTKVRQAHAAAILLVGVCA